MSGMGLKAMIARSEPEVIEAYHALMKGFQKMEARAMAAEKQCRDIAFENAKLRTRIVELESR